MAVLTRLKLIGATIAMAAPVCAMAAPADDIRILLEAGKREEAYAAGTRNRQEAGKPAFDCVFGVAALHANRVSEGVLVLERCLLNDPQNVPARLELARGYYLLADDARARDEFEAILALKPPAQLARVVREYLAAIATRESRHRTQWTFSAEVGGGHDSNVQSGVSDPNITLPIFGDITLADSAVRRRDRFGQVTFGGRISVPARPRLAGFLQAGAELRQYDKVREYDQYNYALMAGLQYTPGAAVYRLSLGRSAQLLDGSRYRDSWSGNLEWGFQTAAGPVVTAGMQLAALAYAGSNAIRDADYYALQAGVRQLFSGMWRLELDASASLAREDIHAPDRQELSRDLAGARLGLSASPVGGWTLALGGSYLESRYRADDPLLMVRRRDRYSAADLSLAYVFGNAWTVRGEYMASRNESNLPLYEYRRNVGQLKLRYDFR